MSGLPLLLCAGGCRRSGESQGRWKQGGVNDAGYPWIWERFVAIIGEAREGGICGCGAFVR